MAASSAYRTRSDVITGALGKLGVVKSNETPNTEDVLDIDEELDSIIRKLEGLEICYIPDRGQQGPSGGNYLAAWFDDICTIVADLTSTKFGLPIDEQANLTQRGLGLPPGTGGAAMSLAKQSRGKATGETLKTEYF